MAFISKREAAGDISYAFFLAATTGVLGIIMSQDGTGGGSVTLSSTVATGVTDGAKKWVRCAATPTNGSNSVATFYTSDDGVSWVQLGDVVTSVVLTGIFNGTAPVEIGSHASGTVNILSGRIYSAQIYNGIGGTLVANFYPPAYAGSGNTFTAPTTGETWTRNGTAFILGDGYHLVAPSDAARMQLGRMPLGGKRNLLSYSQEFDNAYWFKYGSTVSANTAVAPDGTMTANTLFDYTNPDVHAIYRADFQTVAATYTYSIYAKKKDFDYIILQDDLPTLGYVYSWFNLANGTVGTVGADRAATIELVGNGWYRCSIRVVAVAATGRLIAFCMSNADGVRDYVGTGTDGIYLWGAQLEVSVVATAYQLVTAVYDTTESGIPSVTWLYGAGTQYYVIQGSKNLTFLHDGTGGNVVMGAYVNKVDDGAYNEFVSSTSSGTANGIQLYLDDSGANVGKVTEYIYTSTGQVALAVSANNAVPRFSPFILASAFATASNPDLSALIGGASVATANTTATPGTGAAFADLTIFALTNGSEILPGYLFGDFAINGLTAGQFRQVQQWFAQQMGADFT